MVDSGIGQHPDPKSTRLQACDSKGPTGRAANGLRSRSMLRSLEPSLRHGHTYDYDDLVAGGGEVASL